MKNLQIFFVLILALSACTGNQEQSKTTTESKNRSENLAAKSVVSIEEVEAGIRNYIDEKTQKGEGYFSINNDSTELNLRLVRVHTEYLSVLGPNRYFACVDLADTTGAVYDVDFFLSGEPSEMDVTEMTVHKLNGKPYYTWQQKEDKTWERVEVENASNKLLGVVEKSDSFYFHYKAFIPQLEEAAEMWLPLAQSSQFQKVSISQKDLPAKARQIEDSEGNQVLYFDLKPEDAGKEILISYSVKRIETGAYEAPNPDLSLNANSTELLPTGGRFSKIVDSLFEKSGEENDLVKARAIYDYIIDNVRYAKQGKYGTGDANYACDTKSGNCTEFHSLFISLARTANIPARFMIGAAIPSARNEGGVNGYHCWAEFYADGKWWPVDISEGNKYSALATYYFGHHPANRIELSRGRDLEMEPSPSLGPIPFFAYPWLESGGEKLEVKTRFSFNRDEEKAS